ncbi:Chromosome (plasmid) partitioning protein ParB / Stage 0 sporulation protein J [Pseudonocardia sp. Ae717_Ps2]|uniref:ParB/RepB/Spo0J family partition protein n=1 Tax=Pseudonocardia sp. Ae717_Ps2 TaxID=1885573 RepID=UPI00094B1C06|nr:ParB/RepB/Spo0J family partition protein [Pseudonocardia sp. Ae717_Ps2]OLM28276.1 Chromosome (plasmid) partitioning protein ParB / Stage 0 sporulation protein J [Pseudonocardia sp. Ae717_Ps2]
MTARTRTTRGLQGDARSRIGRRGAATEQPTEGASAGSTPPQSGGILGALAAAVEEPPGAGERVLDVQLGALAPHPDNVRDALGDVTSLAASIAERGVLQPLVVVSRAAFGAARPDVELDAGAEWVILAGHRRLAGAQLAAAPTVPVVVRDELAGDDDAVVSMLVENLQRQDLTPMEEARAFGRLRGRGFSERRISKETGVSAGQVHKRLSLLRLPEPVAAALGSGALTVADALRLLELPDGEIAAAWSDAQRDTWRGVRGVVEYRLAVAEADALAGRLREQLRAAGIELIDDPAAEFGRDHYRHQLGANFAVPGVEARVADGAPPLPDGALAHVARHGQRAFVGYYTRDPADDHYGTVGGASGGSTTNPGPAGPGAGGGLSDEEERRRRDAAAERERARLAADARAQACARLVAGDLDAELAGDILADTLLVSYTVEPYEFAATAAEWCGVDLAALEEGLEPELADAFDDIVGFWMAREAALGGIRARRAAVAVALAEAEHLIAHPMWWPRDGRDGRDADWPERARRHVRRLAAVAGYELTDDDHRRLAPAPAADEPAAAGASGGSTPDPEGSPA